ncbi:MAG: hypothetical protein IJE54_01740 [Peptococcaceae bacterium]|nr:hypothetical protein [Peptococcaceae bacterium]
MIMWIKYDEELNPKVMEEMDELANEIDAFSQKYDYHGYRDAIEDVDEYWQQLTSDIYTGDVQHLLDWLEPIVEEDDKYSEEAKILAEKITRYKK